MTNTIHTSTHTKPQILVKRNYNYNISKVWKALTDKNALSTWLMPTSDFELTVGQQFQFKTKPRGKFDGIVNCEILEYTSPTHIVYSWRSTDMKQATIVEWELKSLDDNKTHVTLKHSGFVGFNGWVTKQILKFGWRNLLKKNLTQYIAR